MRRAIQFRHNSEKPIGCLWQEGIKIACLRYPPDPL
jgi:hypothetical protein